MVIEAREAHLPGGGVRGSCKRLNMVLRTKVESSGRTSSYCFIVILCASVFCLHVYLGSRCVSGSHGNQKRALHPLELKLQMVMCCHLGVGMEPKSSGRVAGALKH